METMATESHSKHAAHTPEYKEIFSNWIDSAYDTSTHETTHIFSLTGGFDEQDIDGEYDENNQIPTQQAGEYSETPPESSTMKFKVKDNETFFAAVRKVDANAGTPPPSETTPPATNAPVTSQRKQKIILKLKKPTPAKRTSGPSPDSLTTAAPVTTKSGRKSKARKVQNDTLEGEDYEAYMGGLTRGGRGSLDEEYIPSSPPLVPLDRRPGRTSHSCIAPPTPIEDFPSSSTIAEDLVKDDFPPVHGHDINAHQGLSNTDEGENKRTTHPFFADIDQDIHQIVAELATQDPVPINLPHCETGVWTAEQLTHLYISAYTSQHWHICDLVADTWIRAFQSVNKSDAPIWRPNKGGWVYQAKNPENFGLDAVDPALEEKVCAFEAKLLNNLYYHTSKECGARMLWADTMALCGCEWEEDLTSRERRNNQWHPDLFYNVMCTALRMVRRKLTLKIEESTEGAWCKRYHVHSLHDLPCYREMARDAARFGGGRKRGAEEMEGEEAEWQARKRVSFANGDDDIEELFSEAE